MPGDHEVTVLLSAWRGGDEHALEQLIPIVYKELRRLAGHYMKGERPGHTLQATALVHEAYLRLAQEQDRTWQNRAHFFAIAAQIMRNLLVDRARAAKRAKRGNGMATVMLDASGASVSYDPEQMLALDVALQRLSEIDPRAGRIIELRCFVGLKYEEIAEVLAISEKTVKRDWTAARSWLQAELSDHR